MNRINILSKRAANVAIAKETIDICNNKNYKSASGKIVNITNELDFAVKNTILYDKNIEDLVFDKAKNKIEIVNETTTSAAKRLSSDGKTNIVALNFASAVNEGGGFRGGSIAQEEDLCRASGLYSCLLTQPDFYKNNKACNHQFYTDDIIYSPNVPFFRDDNQNLLDDPYTLSIITAPAPCVRDMDVDEQLDEKINNIILLRVKKVLQIAAKHNHKNIILGAAELSAINLRMLH